MTATTYSAASTAVGAATLGENFGYRFDGDSVTLNADIESCNHDALDRDWRLQLWACPQPYEGGHMQGFKVADFRIADIAQGPVHVELSGFANIPTGSQHFSMVTVLATQEPARFATIHDYANYPLTQSFLAPRMTGTVGYRFDGTRVQIDVEGIENLRDTNNVSGTLALELWAIPDRYAGGIFQGTGLTGIAFGTLQGQEHLQQLSFNLPLNRNVIGEQYVVLMLREWTPVGYVTRDFTCFANPVAFAGNNDAAQQDKRTANKSSSILTKTLIAALGSALAAKKPRGKFNNSAVSIQTNVEYAAQSVKAEDAMIRKDVLRSRGQGRRLLAKANAVSKAAGKETENAERTTNT